MGLVDVVKSWFGVGGVKKNTSLIRPTELDVWTRGSGGVERIPTMPYLGFRFINEIYTYSDLLKTIIRSLVQETFRKGIEVVPRFISKCNFCGTEYDTKVDKCNVCGGDSLRSPNPYEGEWLEKFINDVNYNDQSLIEVLQDVDVDLNIYDNAFLAVVKRYMFDDEGKVVAAEVVEILRANPENVMLVMDRDGRPARTDDGKVVLFCLEHRDRQVVVPPEKVGEARCGICKKVLYPAYFSVRKLGVGGKIYYANGEILHIKKFTHGLGYGISPIFSVWMKVLTLMKQDYFILMAYHLERSPRGLLVLKGNVENIQKAWRTLMSEAERNPHIIYPLVVEGMDKTNRIAEWIDLTFSSKDIDFIAYREEVRRTVGAIWGVMPIFHGDMSAGTGLANEGLQIVVTNRAVEREQELFNTKVLYWLSNQLGLFDWTLRLVPNEGRDIVARIQRETMRIANAERMAALGYRPVAVKTDDGIDFYFIEGGEREVREGQSGYIASKVYQEIPESEIPRYEGEPEHGRPRVSEQRFEGEELARRPKTYVVGEGGELVTQEEETKSFFLEKQGVEIPSEYRRYVRREDVGKLPKGIHVYEGPRGGLYIDSREYKQVTGREFGEERERRVTEPETERRTGKVKTYSGSFINENLKYDAEVDEDAKTVKLKITKGDRQSISLVFDVGKKKMKLEDLKGFWNERLEEYYKKAIDGLPNASLLSAERDVGDEYYKRLWPYNGYKGINNVLEAFSRGGESASLSLLQAPHVLKVSKNPEEFLNKNVHLWSEKSEGSKCVFLYVEGEYGNLWKSFSENIDMFKKYVSDKFGGSMVFVPRDSFRFAGGLYTTSVHTFVQNKDLGTVFHEYFHYIFHLYETLYRVQRNLRRMLFSIFESFSEENIKYWEFGGEIRNKIPLGDEVSKIYYDYVFDEESVAKAVEEYLDRADFSESSVREAFYVSKLKNMLRGYRQALKYMGGVKVLKMFQDLIKIFDADDGLSEYSRGYHRAGHPHFRTEAFASIGDHLADYITRMGEGAVGRFTKSNVIKYLSERPRGDTRVAVRFRDFGENLNVVLKKSLDFFDAIGLIKWEEGE